MKAIVMENMSVPQAIELVNMFADSLRTKKRSQLAAESLIGWRRIKIDYLVKRLFWHNCGDFFFEPPLPAVSRDYFNLPEGIAENAVMSAEQALEIIKVFGVALRSNFCLKAKVDEVITLSKKEIDNNVDELFELSPGLSLFEHKMYIQKAALASFTEVQTFDEEVFSVCIDDVVCKPYGLKNGDRLGNQYTVIGVAPKDRRNLALWLSDDAIQYRSSLRPVVECWNKDYLFEKFWIELGNKHLEHQSNN